MEKDKIGMLYMYSRLVQISGFKIISALSKSLWGAKHMSMLKGITWHILDFLQSKFEKNRN